jgi:purine catabolism regulator
MFPTVADVLALPAFRRGGPRVVAGERGLGRTVRWVHSSEVADIASLLRGGELVLSTGIALPADRDGLVRYVTDLAEVGASGLAVEMGRRYSDTLPRVMVATAERHGMPLIELNLGTRFISITEAVHALIVDAQLAELRASEEIHQAFNELAVEGARPEEVVRQTARMAGLPVVLENLSHQVLAFDAAGGDAEALLEGWEDRSRRVRVTARTGHDSRAGWLVTVVGARGHDWGRLVLVTGDPTPRQVMLLERGASTLALNRLVLRDRDSLERQTHRTLLNALLSHAQPAAEVALRARALGVPLEGRRLVGVVLRTRRGPNGPGAGPGAGLEAQARLRDLSEIAATAVRDRRLAALVGTLDDESVGLLIALGAQEREHETLADLAAALRRQAHEVSGGRPAQADERDPLMAVGSAVDSVRDARRSLLEATQVADAALHQAGDQAYWRLPDVRLRGLLHLLRDDARLQTFLERELGPLLAYDSQHGTQLVHMLSVYLDNGRNKSAAADAAHLSRPSMYERLRRIERVLGVDLDSVESCLSLHVALLALSAVRG